MKINIGTHETFNDLRAMRRNTDKQSSWKVIIEIFVFIIILLYSGVLIYYLIPQPNFSIPIVLNPNNAILELQSNGDFLIFNGTLVITFIIGIITLIPLLKKSVEKKKDIFSIIHVVLLSIFYFIFVGGLLLSLSRVFEILRENYFIISSGILGLDYKTWLEQTTYYEFYSGLDTNLVIKILICVISFFDLLFITIFLNKSSQLPDNKPSKSEQREVESTSEKEKNINIEFSSNEKKDILLKRFEESFKEIRSIQDYNWKGITIVTTAVTALIGSTEILKIQFVFKLPFALIALIFVLIGLFMLIRDREPFLEHLVIISRIENLLGIHDKYEQFTDNKLVPDHYKEGSNNTYEKYIILNKWKKKSLFFGFFSLYISLIVIIIFWIILSYYF